MFQSKVDLRDQNILRPIGKRCLLYFGCKLKQKQKNDGIRRNTIERDAARPCIFVSMYCENILNIKRKEKAMNILEKNSTKSFFSVSWTKFVFGDAF